MRMHVWEINRLLKSYAIHQQRVCKRLQEQAGGLRDVSKHIQFATKTLRSSSLASEDCELGRGASVPRARKTDHPWGVLVEPCPEQ